MISTFARRKLQKIIQQQCIQQRKRTEVVSILTEQKPFQTTATTQRTYHNKGQYSHNNEFHDLSNTTTKFAAVMGVVAGGCYIHSDRAEYDQEFAIDSKLSRDDETESMISSLSLRDNLSLNLKSINDSITQCDAALTTPARMHSTKPFMASNIRRHQTIQKMYQTSVKDDTLESNYIVNWDTPLGEGSFGQVFLATDRKTSEELAVKKISKQYTNNASFQREMDALLHLRNHNGHPHICGLRENYDEGNFYYLVLDLVQGGEMFDHLCTNGAYSEADAARLIREVANALAFLHGIGIVHGDMKPENLMLSSTNTDDAVIKVVDFGCAQTIVEDEDGHMLNMRCEDDKDRGAANTPAYCPPEILERKNAQIKKMKAKNKQTHSFFPTIQRKEDISQLDPSFDMWALGVILYIMLTGVHPFDLYGNATDAEIEHQILARQRPPLRNSPLTAHLSSDAISVIESLMQWDPKKRLTAHELLLHPWVRGETALTKKMADSDKRLSAYRAYKTKLEAKVFADMASLTTSSNDDDEPDLYLEEDLTNRNHINSGFKRLRTPRNDINNSRDQILHQQPTQRFKSSGGGNDVAKRTSLIEMAFHRLDPQHKGYVTTADLKRLKSLGGKKDKNPDKSGSESSSDSSANKEDDPADHMNLSAFSDLLSENMKNRYFPKGHIVYHEGDVGNVMYFINSGSVEVYTKDGFSKTLRTPGDFFGEGALLHPKKIRSASIRCVTPVHAIEISREYFEKYLASDMNVKLNLREKDKSRKRQRAKAILRLQQSMQERKYKPGEKLFEEGEEGEVLYILEEGKVDISVKNHYVFSLKPGEMCGEHSLIFGKPRNTTATCVGDEGCLVHVLRSRDFFFLLDTNPSTKESIKEICLRREFQKALCLVTKHAFPHTEEDLRKAFDVVDTKRLGYLDLQTIRGMIEVLDPTYTEEDILAILQSLDLDETGKVSWQEFKRIFGIDCVNRKTNGDT